MGSSNSSVSNTSSSPSTSTGSDTFSFRLLQEAVDFVTRAVEEDTNKNYEEALRLYEYSLKKFAFVLKYSILGVKAKETTLNKCYQYRNRVKKIEYYLRTKWQKETQIITTTDWNNYSDSSSDEDDDDLFKKEKWKLVKSSLTTKPRNAWSNIVGLTEAKKALKEAILVPLKFSESFDRTRKKWEGVLLFGPIGSGKSLLSEAVSTEAENSAFFSVSSSYLLTVWLEESATFIQKLFQRAQRRKPSIILIEEIHLFCDSTFASNPDAFLKARKELITQLRDAKVVGEDIFMLAATSKPWLLDEDIKRNFGKKIYVPLPDEKDRYFIFKLHMGSIHHSLNDYDFKQLAIGTNGHTGGDISVAIQHALMQLSAKVQASSHFCKVCGPSPTFPNIMEDDLLTPCSPSTLGAMEMSWKDVPIDKLLKPQLTMDDIVSSVAKYRLAIVGPEDLKKFKEFVADNCED